MSFKARHQFLGQVIERSGTFYIRYYRTETGQGKLVRRRVSSRLCEKDHVHRSAGCKAVRDLRDKFMLEVNKNSTRVNRQDVPVAEFWEKTYKPWCEENLRASSVYGYEKVWELYLEPALAGKTLQAFETHEGSALLTALSKRLTQNSLSHVRSLASAIFSHAVNLGVIARNPWREVKVLAKVRKAPPTKAYTLEQAESIMSALSPRIDAQAVFGLGYFMGLRPSELAAVQWRDVDFEAGVLHIRRSVVRGNIDETKTEGSAASVMMIEPVAGLLEMWAEKSLFSEPPRRDRNELLRSRCSGNSAYVFPNRAGGPLNIESFCFHIIKPLLDKAEILSSWSGLYSARRGNGTILTELTGNALAAQKILRHQSLVTTSTFYIKPSTKAGNEGMKLLEAQAGKQKKPAAGTKSDTGKN